MEPSEQSTEDQAPPGFQQGWESPGELREPARSAGQRRPQPAEPVDQQIMLSPEISRPDRQDFSENAQVKQKSNEALLSTLTAAAQTLESAEGGNILSLALQTFLSISGGAGGLVLASPEASAPRLIAICQNIPEDLAMVFARHLALLETFPEGVVRLPSSTAQTVQNGAAGSGVTSAALLVNAGVRWYQVLPLLVQGRVEALLAALGYHEPARLSSDPAVFSAEALLGTFVGATLERAQLRHSLAQEERARDEFIGLSSHELKSPLTIIKGYAQLLLRQARRTEGRVDLGGLEAINNQVNRMSGLVGQLLDVSRIERGVLEVQPKPVELVALVRRLLEQRQRQLAENSLLLIAREPAVLALADPARVEQVLGYLLDNAIKFGRENGPVEVTVERAPLSRVPTEASARTVEPYVGDGARAPDEVALLAVRDYGLGLPVEERGKLFTAFYRGPENGMHRQLAGLGLGLYLSRYLVSRQDGQLWAEFPNAGHFSGSIFLLSLPLISAA